MDSLSYKTVSINKKNADKQWVVVDAADQILGRFSSKVAEIHDKDSTRLVEKSIKGMLPKNKLGAELFRNLYVVAGSEHPYDGQKPTDVNINELK